MYIIVFLADIHNMQICRLMHYVLKPSNKVKLANGKFWKMSISDSIESFLVEVLDSSYVPKKINLVKEFCIWKNLKLQPFIIFVNSTIPQFCVVYDGIFYSFNNFLVALDVCFKIFFIFNLEYPKQSYKFWLFIQNFFYKIQTKHDHLTSDIIDAISELSK